MKGKVERSPDILYTHPLSTNRSPLSLYFSSVGMEMDRCDQKDPLSVKVVVTIRKAPNLESRDLNACSEILTD